MSCPPAPEMKGKLESAPTHPRHRPGEHGGAPAESFRAPGGWKVQLEIPRGLHASGKMNRPGAVSEGRAPQRPCEVDFVPP